MKNIVYLLLIFFLTVFISCDSDDDIVTDFEGPIGEITETCTDGIQNGDEEGVDCGGTSCVPCVVSLVVPDTYEFQRDGVASDVRIPGQIERLSMLEEIDVAFTDFDGAVYGGFSAELLNGIYNNEGVNFTNDFLNSETSAGGVLDLNNTTRQLRNTTADSEDYFVRTGNSAEAATIRTLFDSFITRQVVEVFPAVNTVATAGNAGQLPDGTSTRFVNANGWEYNEVFEKGLVGALILDQVANNYLSPTFLDNDDNRATNDAGTPRNDSGTDTQMEHQWDEGFGYIYGASCDVVDVARDLGENDGSYNNYLDLVNDDEDFRGIADTIYLAFRTGRAAITASDYDLRDQQAAILQRELSRVMAIRTVFYLQSGRIKLEAARNGAGEFGDAFHDISEGLGFLLGLRYTQDPTTNAPYYTPEIVMDWFNSITEGTPNGLWDIEVTTLNNISDAIATPFEFTSTQAESVDNSPANSPGCN